MKRPSHYHTKQGDAILAYIASLDGAHVTVEHIFRHFENQGIPIGLTTIYRNLEKLLTSGKIRKYTLDGTSSACYQYAEEPPSDGDHFHLKCEACGELFHLQCETLQTLHRHVASEHAFQINQAKTVFYGTCHQCSKDT